MDHILSQRGPSGGDFQFRVRPRRTVAESFFDTCIDMGKQSKRRKDIPKVRASILDSMVHHQSSAVDGYKTPSFILKATDTEYFRNPWNLDGFSVASECVGMLYPREPLPKLEGNEKLLLAGVWGSLCDGRTMLDVGEKQINSLCLFEDAKDAIAEMHNKVWWEVRNRIKCGRAGQDVVSTVCACLLLIKTIPSKVRKGYPRERVFVGALAFDARPIVVTPKIIGVDHVYDYLGSGTGFNLELLLYCMLCRTHGHLICKENGKALADALVDAEGAAEAMCTPTFKKMIQEMVLPVYGCNDNIFRAYCRIHVVLKRRLWMLQMGHCAKRSQSPLRMISQDAFRAITGRLFHEMWMKQQERFAEEKFIWSSTDVFGCYFREGNWD